jgi:phage tail-like protein
MAASMSFRLVIEGPEKSWQIPLEPGSLVIGRVPGNQLVLEHQQVSRRHAQITCSVSEVQIVDLNSSNGTYLNAQKLTPGMAVAINPSDVIKIGPFTLVLAGRPVEDEPSSKLEAPPEVAVRKEPIEEETPALPILEVPLAQAAAWRSLTGAQPGQGTALDGAPGDGTDGSSGSAPPGDGRATATGPDGFEPVPKGLSINSQRLIHYLPGIYQTAFMERFLGIFESILIPIEWNVDNFDLFLDPRTAPAGFLPWLAAWYGILFQPQWDDAQRRAFLKRAHFLFARRGTRLALAELLQIFTGQPVEIDDTSQNLPAATFRVRLPLRKEQVDLEQLSALIDAHKPAHTSYFLEFSK